MACLAGSEVNIQHLFLFWKAFLVSWLVLKHVKRCWVILCQHPLTIMISNYVLYKISMVNRYKNDLEFEIMFKIIVCAIQIRIIFKQINWPVNGTITDTTTPSQSGPGSNGNKEDLHTLQISRTGASPCNVVLCHTSFRGGMSYLSKRGIQSAYS